MYHTMKCLLARTEKFIIVKSTISLYLLRENSIQFCSCQFCLLAETLNTVAVSLTVVSVLVLLFRHHLISRISSFLTYPLHLVNTIDTATFDAISDRAEHFTI